MLKEKSRGFTLVELAIAMVIIGLLIGGVLKGQELIKSSRVNGTISQLKSYKATYDFFESKYQSFPGDIRDATARLPGCNVANSCLNGNGDRYVGGVAFGMWEVEQTGNAFPGSETSQFWKHLALADLITGVSPSADTSNPVLGQTHPSAKIGGAITALYSPTSGIAAGPGSSVLKVGNLLRLQSTVGPPGALSPNSLTVRDALEIDTKMDDGNSVTGMIQGEGGCDNAYVLSETENCTLFFRLR